MEKQHIRSSILRSVRYDEARKNLEIEFRSGLIHQYQNVPSKIHAGLISASSAGIFYTENIRNRFRSVRLDKTAA